MTPKQNQATEYKRDIMARLGGESVFEFVVLGMVERLQQDATMDGFFSSFGSTSLDSLQRTVLTTMLTKHDDDEYDEDGFILLRYYNVIQQGFNETHFDILVKHFIDSLQDAWVEDAVFDDAVQIVKSFRPIFVNGIRRTDQIRTSEEFENDEANSTSNDKEKRSVRRGASGEFLLKMMRPRGAKRTKQIAQ